jgi:hypothetical protein
MPVKSFSRAGFSRIGTSDGPGMSVRPKAAAQHMGGCIRTVYQMLNEGKVESKLVRGCRLIRLKSLEEYIASF